MKAWAVIVFTVFWAISCNQVVNPNPIDPGEEPTEEAKVLKRNFPEAKDIIFKPILPGTVWEAQFNSGADKYTSLVDKVKMWATYRAAENDSTPALMSELLAKTIFGGGTFSNNTEDISYYSTGQRFNRLIYRLNGTDLSFEWNAYKGPVFKPSNATFELIKYQIKLEKLTDFPQTIQAFMAARPELSLINGDVRVKLDDEKQFLIYVFFKKYNKDQMGSLLFDEKGNLKWASQAFNQPELPPVKSNIDTLPATIQKFLDESPELKTLTFQQEQYDKWRGEYEGISSYYLKLRGSDYSRICELMFDQDGNLLNKRYFIILL